MLDLEKLTDLEILKRITKIQGLNKDQSAEYDPIVDHFGKTIGFNPYNPLNNDTMMLALMLEHQIWFEYTHDYNFCVRKRMYEEYYKVFDDDLNRAVCLMVIMSKEPVNDA